MEAPKHWNLPGVGGHCLYETPDQEHKYEIEHDEHEHDPNALRGSRSPHTDECVVDEGHHCGN